MESQLSVSADGKGSATWDGLSPASLTWMHSLTNSKLYPGRTWAYSEDTYSTGCWPLPNGHRTNTVILYWLLTPPSRVSLMSSLSDSRAIKSAENSTLHSLPWLPCFFSSWAPLGFLSCSTRDFPRCRPYLYITGDAWRSQREIWGSQLYPSTFNVGPRWSTSGHQTCMASVFTHWAILLTLRQDLDPTRIVLRKTGQLSASTRGLLRQWALLGWLVDGRYPTWPLDPGIYSWFSKLKGYSDMAALSPAVPPLCLSWLQVHGCAFCWRNSTHHNSVEESFKSVVLHAKG